MEPELEQKLNDQLNSVETEEIEETEQTDEVQTEEIEETEEAPEPEEKPLSRSEQRFQKLANERAEEKAKRELAEKQAEFFQREVERLRQVQRQPEEELDPDEKWRRDANQAIRETQFMAADMSDKATFLTKYSKDPDIIAMNDRIEAKLAEVRKNGANPPRENVLTFLLGQDALEKRSKAPAIRKEAAARVKEAQGKPLASKSNVAATKSSPSLYERIKDIPL